MDNVDSGHPDRRTRPFPIIELVAVCQLHGARARLDPNEGICVTLEHDPIHLEWWWHWRAGAASLDVGAAASAARYPDATPAQWGDALSRFGELLSDDAFHAALAVCLTRIKPHQAAALRRHGEQAARTFPSE